MLGSAQRLVSRHCGRIVLFPGEAGLSDRDDRNGLPAGDRGVATARVVGLIGGHDADLFDVRGLGQHLQKHRALTVAAGGKFHRAIVRRGRVHGQTDLTPPLVL